MKRLLFIPLALSFAFPAFASSGGLDVKSKSSFTMENNSRNPFWPIGWKPSARLSDPGAMERGASEISASAFVVSSITLGKTSRFAIVNGKIMGEGQQFGLQVGTQTYQITLRSILDGKVVFARRDQEIVVPLRRK